MAVTELFARRATLARSLRLLTQFRYEQRDPARFYGAIAAVKPERRRALEPVGERALEA